VFLAAGVREDALLVAVETLSELVFIVLAAVDNRDLGEPIVTDVVDILFLLIRSVEVGRVMFGLASE